MTLDARYPVALLPVRLEARFAGPLLKVRIFPDEIFADTHETGLTVEERADAAAYVAAMHAGIDAEKEAWRALVSRWTAPRAAFIVLAAIKGSPETRAESWSRASQAMLPDQWVVRAYQGATVYTKTSAKVQQPLALTFSPTTTDADRVTLADNLSIDAELKWTVDFVTAESVGMAVTLDLSQPDLPSMAVPPAGSGVDLLVVVGVSESLSADDGAARLRALLDAQHYTRGLAFLRPGTPTNNTHDQPSMFPPDDPNGAISFAMERGAALVTPTSNAGCNGLRLARALGLPLAAGEQVPAVEHMDGAAVDNDGPAAAMNDALWPATLGYFMEQMMVPLCDASAIASGRSFFVEQVRGGGPLTALRVGRVPYAVLPALSLTRYSPDSQLSETVRALRDVHFSPAVAQAPRVTPGSDDPDGDLLKVLANEASCRLLRMRILLGQQLTSNTAGLLGQQATKEAELRQAARVAAANAVLGTVRISGETRIAGINGGHADELIGAPLVTSAPLSEEFGLEGANGAEVNYIRWLHDNATGNVDAVKNDQLPGTARPLLYRLLRHALLVEMDRLAFPRLLATNVVAATDRVEMETVRLTASDTRLTTYQRIDRALTLPTFRGDLSPYLSRLATLASLPTVELQRRFGETLDTCSHRLDAWITALATERLWTMRSAAPSGCHLGGFGWVEDIRPAGPQTSVGGYIHAPSSAQASAAAILRNGFISRGGEGSAYAIDLSSSRVRDALALIDGTRQGEPVSALLGYRFERDLHERQLEPLIAPLRGLFPLVAGKTPEGNGPTETVAARNVVDGLALRRAWNNKATPFSDGAGLPALSPAQTQSFHDALDALNACIDGLADVLTAESIFQAVRGNPMRAAASLDSMAAGVTPPEPEMLRTPIMGTSFTQRLVVALPGAAAPPAGSWGAPTSRASAEPYLDNWAGTLLGSPEQIGCTVFLADGSKRPVMLAALKLRPLDVIALARTATSDGDGELTRRVLAAAGAPTGARVEYGNSTSPLSFAVVLEFARSISELLAVSRPLTPGDLVEPVRAAIAAPGTAEAQEAATRARTALQQLTAASTALQQAQDGVAAKLAAPGESPTAAEITALRSALAEAAMFGVAGVYPTVEATAADLAAIATGALRELSARSKAASALNDTDPSALLAAAAQTVQAVFGRDFVFLPRVVAPLASSLAASPALVGDPHLPRQVLQQVARVRSGAGRWRAMWIYAQAFGAAAPSLEVVQVPAAAKWAGTQDAVFAPGTLSLIIHRPVAAPAESGWTGFVVDEWNETVPGAVQKTAVAYRYETPVAEAPQAVLLAVPATSAATWDTDTLIDTVRETLLLAKIRAVDSSVLGGLRPFLPAICLTGNTANEAVSTDFLRWVIAEPMIRSS